MDALQQQLGDMSLKRRTSDQVLLDRWKERDRKLWERVESAIKVEEDQLRARLEAERRAREEEERKRRAEEERRRADEERRQAEEERKRQAEEDARRKEEEARKKKELEEKVAREREEAERKKREEQQGEGHVRAQAGIPTSEELWLAGMRNLRVLKTQTMRAVKGPKPPDPEPFGYRAPPAPPLKKLWSERRRKITPKVGQLTDDAREIARIVRLAPMPLSQKD